MCAVHRAHSLRCNTEEAFRSSAAFRRRIAAARLDVSLGFQAIKRGIDSADGHLAASPQLDFLSHRNPIRPIVQPQKCQHNDVLEFTEVIATKHYLYNIE